MRLQTVTGGIETAALGRTLFHEHLLVKYPGAEFDPKTKFDRGRAVDDAVRHLSVLRETYGVASFVDPCPIELGRDAAFLAEVSEKSGVAVVCTTGFYYGEAGLPAYWRHSTTDQIAEFYLTEITQGILETGVKAGALKCATGGPVLGEGETKCLEAASRVQRETGVAILTHTQGGLGGPEQQDVFAGHGVDLGRVVIGHCCENPNPDYHIGIARRGSYVGFDRIGWDQFQLDSVRADTLVAVWKAGYGAQILVSQDRFSTMMGRHGRPMSADEQAKVEQAKRDNRWPPPFSDLFTVFFPMLEERGMPKADIWKLVDDNPRRFFAGEPIPASVPPA